MMNFAGCRGFGGMFPGGGMFLYSLIAILIIIAIVYLISNNHNSHHKNLALETLDNEYAKGNVSDDDYKKRKENLTN